MIWVIIYTLCRFFKVFFMGVIMENDNRFTKLSYSDDVICVYDNNLDCSRLMGIEECFDLLNQKERCIKDLKEVTDSLIKSIGLSFAKNTKLSDEIESLKDKYEKVYKKGLSQNQFAIRGLNKLARSITRELWAKAESGGIEDCCYLNVMKIINRQIKKLKGEDCE